MAWLMEKDKPYMEKKKLIQPMKTKPVLQKIPEVLCTEEKHVWGYRKEKPWQNSRYANKEHEKKGRANNMRMNTHPSIIIVLISNTIDFKAQLQQINSYWIRE